MTKIPIWNNRALPENDLVNAPVNQVLEKKTNFQIV